MIYFTTNNNDSHKSIETLCEILKHISLVKSQPLTLDRQYFVSSHLKGSFLPGHMSCASLNSLETDSLPRKELKGQLETSFKGPQLVNITAEASISIIITRTKLLQANTKWSMLL